MILSYGDLYGNTGIFFICSNKIMVSNHEAGDENNKACDFITNISKIKKHENEYIRYFCSVNNITYKKPKLSLIEVTSVG